MLTYFFLKTLDVSGQHPPPPPTDPFSRLKQMKKYLWSSLMMFLLVHIYAFS